MTNIPTDPRVTVNQKRIQIFGLCSSNNNKSDPTGSK